MVSSSSSWLYMSTASQTTLKNIIFTFLTSSAERTKQCYNFASNQPTKLQLMSKWSSFHPLSDGICRQPLRLHWKNIVFTFLSSSAERTKQCYNFASNQPTKLQLMSKWSSFHPLSDGICRQPLRLHWKNIVFTFLSSSAEQTTLKNIILSFLLGYEWANFLHRKFQENF